MTEISVRRIFIGGLTVMTLGLAACGDSQESARESLQKSNYEFTVGDFFKASKSGDADAVETFKAAGMSVDAQNVNGETALMMAASSGDTEMVAKLFEMGAQPNVADYDGRTPLLVAAKSGSADVVRTLIKNGADPGLADSKGWTPIAIASFQGNDEVVDALASKSRSQLNKSLLLASYSGNTKVIDTLLNHGAFVDFRSPNDETPLMIAASNGHAEAVKLLLHNGANRFGVKEGEFTAANLAENEGFLALSDFLNRPPGDEELDPASDSELAQDLIVGKNGKEILVSTQVVNTDANVVSPPSLDGASITVAGSSGSVFASSAGQTTSAAPGQPAKTGSRTGFKTASQTASQTVFQTVFQTASKSGSVANRLAMYEYRERQLPVLVKSVDENSQVASVKVLYGDQREIEVSPGDEIADTGLRVVRVKQQYTTTKGSRNSLLDISKVVVQDTRNGGEHDLVRGTTTTAGKYAVVGIPGEGKLYRAEPEDEFLASGGAAGSRFRVLDVRTSQLILEDLKSGEVFTIPRTAPVDRGKAGAVF